MPEEIEKSLLTSAAFLGRILNLMCLTAAEEKGTRVKPAGTVREKENKRKEGVSVSEEKTRLMGSL